MVAMRCTMLALAMASIIVDQQQHQFAIAWLRHANHWTAPVNIRHLDGKYPSHRIQKVAAKFRGAPAGAMDAYDTH